MQLIISSVTIRLTLLLQQLHKANINWNQSLMHLVFKVSSILLVSIYFSTIVLFNFNYYHLTLIWEFTIKLLHKSISKLHLTKAKLICSVLFFIGLKLLPIKYITGFLQLNISLKQSFQIIIISPGHTPLVVWSMFLTQAYRTLIRFKMANEK